MNIFVASDVAGIGRIYMQRRAHDVLEIFGESGKPPVGSFCHSKHEQGIAEQNDNAVSGTVESYTTASEHIERNQIILGPLLFHKGWNRSSAYGETSSHLYFFMLLVFLCRRAYHLAGQQSAMVIAG